MDFNPYDPELQTIPQGDQVLLVFGSANHGERKIADPRRLRA